MPPPFSAPQIKVPHAMGELHMIGKTTNSKKLVGTSAGYTNVASSSYVKAIQKLSKEGYVHVASGNLTLTNEGIRVLPPTIVPPIDNADVHQRLLPMIGNANNAKLQQLWDILADGESHSIAALASSLGYSNANSSSFQRPIRKMTVLGMATRSNGVVQLKDMAFPFGRP